MNVLKASLAVVTAWSLSGCIGADKPVQSAEAGGKKVTLSTSSGQLTNGENAVTLTFTNASGQSMPVETPTVRFTMPAEGTMAEMNAVAKLEPGGQLGVFKGTVDLGMKGPWQTAITFRDNTGEHRASFTVQAQ